MATIDDLRDADKSMSQVEHYQRRLKMIARREKARRGEIERDFLLELLLENARLETENDQLRALIPEEIVLEPIEHTPATISNALNRRGYRATERTVIHWLGQWWDAKKKTERPTRWRFPHDALGCEDREDLRNFLNWCGSEGTKKLKRKK